jgi:transcriptional regulator with GAF, ATPase, and Fis domain
VIGETGTGKELVARAIHEGSFRRAGPFVAVNCGAIPRELIESELFGHERGAFTGAVGDRDGVFVQADGGTLFLDELGELPRSQQPPLLRALEARRVRRVGGQGERAVDVRVIAATNRLSLSDTDSPLRQDLYHRVATVVIELPPLRARPGDIEILVNAFIAELEPTLGPRRISVATLSALTEYHWPGNVRELRHAIQRAVTLCPDELALDCLLPSRRSWSVTATQGAELARAAEPREDHRLARRGDLTPFEAAKRDLILDAYERCGSIRKAASTLGLAKSTYADYLRRYLGSGG